MRTSKFMGVVCAAFVALSLGAPHAGALTPSPGDGPPHRSDSPSVEQKNVNAPFSFLSAWSNNGDVHQSNGVDSSSKSDYPSKHDQADKRQECNCSQSDGQQYGGDNKDRRDNKDREHKHRDHKERDHKDRNRYQSDQGGNCGCDHNPPKHNDNNNRDRYQSDQGGNCGCDHNPPKHDDNNNRDRYQSDQGGNSCGCDNQGDSGYDGGNRKGDHPEVKQVNVNAPISIASVDSNNGDVHQSNDSGSSKSYGNGTEQKNINVPISILSLGSNNGDVHQSNDTGSSSDSSGYQSSDGKDSSSCGCSQDGGGPKDGGSYGGGGGMTPTSTLGQLPGVNMLVGQSGGGGSPLGGLGL